MNPVTVSETSFDDLVIPKTIYKYRTWTNPYHLYIIINKELYMASPRDFIDPYDCKNPIRYDLLSDKEIFNLYLYHSKKDNKNWNRKKHLRFAQEWAKKTLLKDPTHVAEMQKEHYNEFCDHFGVLSLTANPNNDEMWKSYSDNHQGFCIGFNTKILFQNLGGGGEVQYYDELPIIHPVPKHSFEQQHILLIFSKLRKWEYEQEYRTHKFCPTKVIDKQRVIRIPPEAFKEIIFGKNMPDSIKEQLLLSISTDLGHLFLLDEE